MRQFDDLVKISRLLIEKVELTGIPEIHDIANSNQLIKAIGFDYKPNDSADGEKKSLHDAFRAFYRKYYHWIKYYADTDTDDRFKLIADDLPKILNSIKEV